MVVHLLGSGGFMPSDRRETASALVVEERDTLLIDAGTGARRLITDRGILDGVDRLHVVLTHFHLDHVGGLFYLAAVERPVEIWGAGEALEHVPTRALVERLVGPPFAPQSFLESLTAIHELDPAGENTVGGFTIRTRTQQLHSNPTVALRLGPGIVWCTDTAYDEANVQFAHDARVLFHEAFSDAGDPDHTAATKAAELAAAAGAERLVLIHVDPEQADDDVLLAGARPIFPSVEVAHDGMRLEVAA